MYEGFWNLNRKPFAESCDRDWYFAGESTQGALLKLRYCVEQKQPAALIIGMYGVGKTYLVHQLLGQLGPEFQPCLTVPFAYLPARELLEFVARELLTEGSPANSFVDCLRQLRDELAENTRRARHAVLVVDEAHVLPDAQSVEVLRMLLNFQSNGGNDLTILLVGQPPFLATLRNAPGLEDRVAVKCVLPPLTPSDTAAYVRHRLGVAGGAPDIFTQAALEAIYEITGGIPRRVNRLCDLALLVGFADERRSIDAGHVRDVAGEMLTIADAAAA